MMQHLLVGNGVAIPKFNANGYYNKKRSDGWYKYGKDSPHHLGLETGAWHTAATQGAWLGGVKGDGGATGVSNNNEKPSAGLG